MNALTSIWTTSIGRKILVALTGLLFIGFLLGHMSGNLLIFAGRDAMNSYAYFLHHFMHGAFIWAFRLIMLIALLIHILATISLTKENRTARASYQHQATVQATRSSRLMIWSGLTILAFLIYHLLHFTARVGNSYGTYIDAEYLAQTGEKRHDAWQMVIDGFSWLPASLFYIIAMLLLGSHLLHGFSSAFQTLGLRSRKSQNALDLAGKIITFLIIAGFLSVPLAVLTGLVGS